MKYSRHKLGGRRIHVFRPRDKLRNSNRLINLIFRPNRIEKMNLPLSGGYKVEVREFNNPTRLTLG